MNLFKGLRYGKLSFNQLKSQLPYSFRLLIVLSSYEKIEMLIVGKEPSRDRGNFAG